MKDKKAVGIEVRSLHQLVNRSILSMTSKKFGDCVTGYHGWVVGYIYDHGDHDVFQRDLENQFSVRRSTMTQILKLMEKNGLIIREPVDYDARLKKLILTPRALEIQKSMKTEIKVLEEKMREGIGQDKLEAFFEVIEKMKQNLS